jgi:transcriptional regulator with XRE-family HTH domain
LQVAHAASAPPDGSDVGEVIRWYRMRENLTQQEAADKLRTTQSRLSKLEKGSQALRDVSELRHIATTLGIPPAGRRRGVATACLPGCRVADGCSHRGVASTDLDARRP